MYMNEKRRGRGGGENEERKGKIWEGKRGRVRQKKGEEERDDMGGELKREGK